MPQRTPGTPISSQTRTPNTPGAKRTARRWQRRPHPGQSTQQESDCCIGGHLLVSYEQYTQQFPGFGLSVALQCSHS